MISRLAIMDGLFMQEGKLEKFETVCNQANLSKTLMTCIVSIYHQFSNENLKKQNIINIVKHPRNSQVQLFTLLLNASNGYKIYTSLRGQGPNMWGKNGCRYWEPPREHFPTHSLIKSITALRQTAAMVRKYFNPLDPCIMSFSSNKCLSSWSRAGGHIYSLPYPVWLASASSEFEVGYP